MNNLPAMRSRPLVLNVDVGAPRRAGRGQLFPLDDIEVIEAENGATALALIAERQPVLVLVDVSLPHLCGPEVCRQIKAGWPYIGVLQISSTAIPVAERMAAMDSGADCHLIRPAESFELAAAVRTMLRHCRTEAQVWESAQYYRVIAEHLVDHAIFACGPDGRVTSWNAGATAMLGYQPQEIIGEPCARLFLAEDVIAEVPENEMRAAQIGQGVRSERWHKRRDGTRFWACGHMAALRDRRGTVTGYLKILCHRTAHIDARDALLVARHELEDKVAERTRELTVANDRLQAEIAARELASEQLRQTQKMEALGHLTGGIAHDFNNLLTAILGGLEVIRRRMEDPRGLRLIDSSISAAQRGARLIAQLMAFARKQNLHAEQLSLNTLVQDMRELLEQSLGTATRIDYDLAIDVWPVLADANQVRIAMVNLAINARDAMPDGGVLRITTSNVSVTVAEPELAAGDYVALSVCDNGTGMPPEVRARLFEPFFTTKDVGQGTGLGLAQIYGFVRQSCGGVRVTTAAGEGTTITLLLPRLLATQP